MKRYQALDKRGLMIIEVWAESSAGINNRIDEAFSKSYRPEDRDRWIEGGNRVITLGEVEEVRETEWQTEGELVEEHYDFEIQNNYDDWQVVGSFDDLEDAKIHYRNNNLINAGERNKRIMMVRQTIVYERIELLKFKEEVEQ